MSGTGRDPDEALSTARHGVEEASPYAEELTSASGDAASHAASRGSSLPAGLDTLAAGVAVLAAFIVEVYFYRPYRDGLDAAESLLLWVCCTNR